MNSRPAARRSPLRSLAVLLAATLPLATALLVVGQAPASAAEPLPDGLSAATAAGSCWEIKQNQPAAPSGSYWLITPKLQAPERFYCDQASNGGGWVLVGRGREGWKMKYTGLRTPAEVRDGVTGPAAFPPAQLPSRTIDGLLNGGDVKALDDGIRLRRAANSSGSAWQEVRFKLTKRDRWAWSFPAVHPVGSFSFDGIGGSGGLTNNFGSNTGLRRVDTNYPSSQGFLWGFAYGSSVSGQNNASTYLWSEDGGGNARPFTQMYLRPKLRRDDLTWPSIPQGGTSKQELRDLPSSDAARTVWGVGGPGDGIANELHSPVQAFAQIGNTVYVAGNFSYVERDVAGTGRTQQPFVAAFDVATGEFIPSFRPVLDGQVRALHSLPDGRLAVGGDFSQASGEPHPGMVILDADTGAPTGWQVDAQDRSIGGVTYVRNFSVQAGQLYVAGSFTHLVQGATESSSWNGGRIDLSTGRPDTGWNPRLNGTSVGVDASDQGGRVYYSGYFSMTGDVATPSMSAVTPAPGAAIAQAWTQRFSDPGGRIWQLDVQEVGDRVYVGGSQHSLFGYDRANLGVQSGSVTKQGGDFQVIEPDGENVLAGCHCGDFTYQDSYRWPDVGTTWTQGDAIDTFGAWDAATGAYQPDFSPTVKGARGWGAWGMFVDSRDTLWVGGDYVTSLRAGSVNQWSGGFVRFNARDTQAPTTPGNVSSASIDSTTRRLQWSASSDNAGAVSYEVLEDNRVIGTTSVTSLPIVRKEGTHRYFVRAIDAEGNRSASTSAFEITYTSPDDFVDFVQFQSDWRWRFASTAPDPTWTDPAYDDSSWAQGAGPLGFGSTGLGTDIGAGAPSPRPLSAQFRRAFQVSDASEIATAEFNVVADDGVIVYLNGEEIGRRNLPAGPLTNNSYATAAPRSGPAKSNPFTFSVPGALLRDGVNVLTAQTHVNYRSTPDVSFDLSVVGEVGEQETPPPPAAPVVTGEAGSATTVDLAWGAVAGAVSYRVVRGGADVATLPAGATSFEDTGRTPETTYVYRVVAVDEFGQETSSADVEVTTPAEGTVESALVERDASWRWRFAAAAPAGDWTGTGFDDSGWALGASPLGFGSAGLGTDIGAGAPSPRPLSAQFRHHFDLADASQLARAEVSVPADDGVIVYVNGVEVGRSNLPAGPVGQNTYATAAPRTGPARDARVTFEVPGALLRDGDNVVAAGTHMNYRSTPDASFDLAMVGEVGEQETPPPPAAPVVTGEAGSATTVDLAWGAVAGATGYRVVRSGADVATLPAGATSFEDTGLTQETTYVYRVVAFDEFGQETSSGDIPVTTPGAGAVDTDLVERDASWRWRFAAAAPAGDWTGTGFDDSGWALGASPLGFGSAGLGTDIGAGAPSPRPLSAQFRHHFDLADASQLARAEVSVPADDGVIVYVNGVEVGRSNLPAGPVGQNTYATAAPRTGPARDARVTFEVPGALLRDGDNVVAAGTHLNYRSTPDASFDLAMVGEVGEQETPPPPAAPVAAANATSPTSVEVSWGDVAGAVEYRVSRGGALVSTVDGTTLSVDDEGLSPSTAYSYRVTALDAFGQETSSAAVPVTTPGDDMILAAGGDWRWRYADTAPAAAWTTNGFDDSAWSLGAGELGFGGDPVATDISQGAPSPRPLTAQFRTQFTTGDLGGASSVTLNVLANDGVIVYVNGEEVGRHNLPAGAIGPGTYATAAPRGLQWVSFEVPVSLLRAGPNVVAGQTHLNWRGTFDVRFDAEILGGWTMVTSLPPVQAQEIVGYTAGVFDLFHVGHLRILQRASAMCDRLVVGVTTDELSLSAKNKAPVVCFDERSAIVAGIRGVDTVVPQTSMDKLDAWERLRFSKMFVGDDWRGTDRWTELESRFAERGVDIVYLPYTTHTSSTLLRATLERLTQPVPVSPAALG